MGTDRFTNIFKFINHKRITILGIRFAYTLAVAMSGKPRASVQVVKNSLALCLKGICIKFEYVSKPVYFRNCCRRRRILGPAEHWCPYSTNTRISPKYLSLLSTVLNRSKTSVLFNYKLPNKIHKIFLT